MTLIPGLDVPGVGGIETPDSTLSVLEQLTIEHLA
jgi:hypothetical protein